MAPLRAEGPAFLAFQEIAVWSSASSGARPVPCSSCLEVPLDEQGPTKHPISLGGDGAECQQTASSPTSSIVESGRPHFVAIIRLFPTTDLITSCFCEYSQGVFVCLNLSPPLGSTVHAEHWHLLQPVSLALFLLRRFPSCTLLHQQPQTRRAIGRLSQAPPAHQANPSQSWTITKPAIGPSLGKQRRS